MSGLQRVLAWWDIDLCVDPSHKRNFTARPLRELEQAIGHRLHVEGVDRYRRMPDGVWKFEAYHYLDTANPVLAVYATLLELARVSEWLHTSWQGFNATPTTQSGNEDDSTICAFYWRPPDQFGLTRYVSSGVQLVLVDNEPNRRVREGRAFEHRSRARPLVKPPALAAERADYTVEFTLRRASEGGSQWPEGIDGAENEVLGHEGAPRRVRTLQTFRNLREDEAIARCLALAPGAFRLKLKRDPVFGFSGACNPTHDVQEGIVGFTLQRL